MNKKLKKGLTTTMAAAMGLGVVIPAVPVIAAPATSGWVLTAQGWTYYKSGVKATGWVLDGGKWYLLDSNGVMKTGWAKDAGTWYFLNASGAMATGWVKDTDGKWYFLKTSGAMAASTWVGNYYLGANGAMAVSTVTEDGYTVDANGAWDGHSKAADLAAATAAVVKAEASKAQADIDAATALVAKLTVVADKTALTARLTAIDANFEVASVSAVNGKTVQITFTKAVDPATVIAAGKLANITFTPVATTPTTPAVSSTLASAVLSDDGKVLTVTPQTTEYFGGQYVVSVPTAVKDVDGNATKAYAAVSTLNDAVRPTVSAPTYTSNGKAKFTFSEPVNATVAQIAAAMTVTKVEDGSNVTVAAGNITLAADKASFTVDLTAAGLNLTADKPYTVTFVGLKDFNGNLITPNPVTYTVTNTVIDNTDPTVLGVTLKSDTNFTVQFSEPLSAVPTVTLNGTDVTSTTPAGTVTVDPDDNTKYNVVLGASGAGIKTIGVSAGYTDLSTNAGSAWSKLVQLTADTTKPSVVSTTVSTLADGKQYLIVKYDETISGVGTALNALSGSYVDADVITHTGVNVAIGKATLYHADGVVTNPTDSLKIDLTGLNAGNYTFTVNAGAAADTAALDSNAKTATFALGTLADTAKPVATVTSVQTTTDKVTVHFDKPVTAATALNLANYTVEGQAIFGNAEFIGDRQSVTLTLNPNTIAIGGLRNFTIANVTSDAGVAMDSTTTQQTFVENVKPTLKSAVLTANDTITVTFSESMAAASLTDNNDFTVKVNGVADTVKNVTGSGSTYKITLNTPVTSLTDTVTLTVSSSNNVTDGTTPANSLTTTGSLVVGQ